MSIIPTLTRQKRFCITLTDNWLVLDCGLWKTAQVLKEGLSFQTWLASWDFGGIITLRQVSDSICPSRQETTPMAINCSLWNKTTRLFFCPKQSIITLVQAVNQTVVRNTAWSLKLTLCHHNQGWLSHTRHVSNLYFVHTAHPERNSIMFVA